MKAYEFYLADGNKKIEGKLIGILPERRHDPKRITSESIMGWGKKVLGEISSVDSNNGLYFIRVEVQFGNFRHLPQRKPDSLHPSTKRATRSIHR